MSYTWVFRVDSASKLCPGPNRTPIVTVKRIALDGKTVLGEATSGPASGTEPNWSFKAFNLPYDEVKGKHSFIKFYIYDKGEYIGESKIKWEFIGEPPKEKSYTLRISNLQNKANTAIGGTIKVHTSYVAGVPYSATPTRDTTSQVRSSSPQLRNTSSQPKKASPASASPKIRERTSAGGSDKNLNRYSRNPQQVAMKLQQNGSITQIGVPGQDKKFNLAPGTRVQFSAAGRREIHIPTSGAQRFYIYGELPELEVIDYDPILYKKKSGGERYGFSLNNALWLVSCATLAYKNEEVIYDVCRNVWDMNGAVFISNPITDTQGFCMHNDKICVVCFRGTESLKDWMTNLKFVLVNGDSIYPERYTSQGLRVHQGFFEACSGVWDQVQDFVDDAYKKFPNLKLYICGHSLGGALANLCHSFFTLSDQNPRFVSGVYTIGQPRVGNRKFKQFLEKASPKTVYIRMTNNQDIVPNLAAGQHVGTHVHINPARKFCFKPPVWVKAANEIATIQGSAKDLQYYGLADHSGPVYQAIVEENWSRFQVLQNGGNNSMITLAETVLLIADMLTTTIASVKRYKPQFRAVVARIINMKPLIDAATDYVVLMDENQKRISEKALVAINKQLAFLHEEMAARKKDKSILQRRSKHESQFNKKLSGFCTIMQTNTDALHALLTSLNASFSEDLAQRFGFNITKYDPSKYDIDFDAINFTEICAKALATRRTKDATAEIALMLESAEEMIYEGELEPALQFLDKMPETPNVQRYMTDEQKATFAFLRAKCHAKLHHHTEAMQALEQMATCGAPTGDMIDDEDFDELANNQGEKFHKIAFTLRNVRKKTPEYEIKLKKNEIQVLVGIFDQYDVEESGFLTSEQFSRMIDTVGVENLLFQLGWKSPKGVVTQIYNIIQRIDSEFNGAINTENYLNLMSTLLPSETQNIGSSAARREQNARKQETQLWDMFKGSG